jgi:hypothetical protein
MPEKMNEQEAELQQPVREKKTWVKPAATVEEVPVVTKTAGHNPGSIKDGPSCTS